MHLEVEQKFRVGSFEPIERRLREMSAEIGQTQEQVDCYFAHPARDFSVTDEAFRVRFAGERNSITYKGPRIDSTTKTRKELELELPLGQGYREQFMELLALLGFRRVEAVRKQRRKSFVDWNGSRIEVSLDDVADVGTYVELELIADEAGLDHARQQLQTLAESLSLTVPERRSYLNLLLETKSAS